MKHARIRLAAAVLLSSFVSGGWAQGEEAAGTAGAAPDPRTLVEMPDAARALMRADMLDHLSALNEIVGLVGQGRYADAGAVAERRLGVSSMGKYRGNPNAPGRLMPNEMHMLGIQMHQSASRFAGVAARGDAAATVGALQELTSACVACHFAYRTQ